ncbi:hypothetical protein [Micromonospora sp. NBC_01813]|uniref:hypothetical protein n=1 Tax=Micromonospora sp. NBC_01813 TaxID=2975988 RepID=UPI002DDBD25D|nr:hypothetical protein [Micromonospora sp. NBC_01813]WSA07014.1 hypothetical protein OG958_22485 [Micromonospora sp. NBC_01813]
MTASTTPATCRRDVATPLPPETTPLDPSGEATPVVTNNPLAAAHGQPRTQKADDNPEPTDR